MAITSATSITGAQCKGARGLLGMTRRNLALATSITVRTIADFERGDRNAHAGTIHAIYAALEAAGVEFIPENGGGPGVRLRKRSDGSSELVDAKLGQVLDTSLQSKDARTITSEQCRAARGLLNWSQPKLAEVLGIARSTIADFERGASDPYPKTRMAIRAAMESAGVIFIDGGDTIGPGVHLRDPEKK